MGRGMGRGMDKRNKSGKGIGKGNKMGRLIGGIGVDENVFWLHMERNEKQLPLIFLLI